MVMLGRVRGGVATRMARRHYSDEERAAALAALKANGGNLELTSKQAGVPRNTLKRWVKHPDHAAPAHLRQKKSRDLGAKLTDLAHQIVDSMPGKIRRASLRDAAVSAGVAIDKARLVQGQPTSINENRRIDASKLTEDEAITLDRLLRRAAVPGSN
jgi:transposase-like protein